MKVYAIRNWAAMFENAGSRKVKTLSWVAIPNRHDGGGFRRLIAMDGGFEMYGAWMVIVQVASRMPVRGLLYADRRALDTEDLSFRTGGSSDLFARTIETLLAPKIGWMEELESTSLPLEWEHATTAHPADPNVVVARPGASGVKQNNFPDTGPDRTGPDPVGQDITGPDSTPAGSDYSTEEFPVRIGTDPELTLFRNKFVLSVAEALGLDDSRALANRQPFNAIAREIQDRPERDELALGLIELAKDKANAGLTNPPAAWQKSAMSSLGMKPAKGTRRGE